MTLRKLLSFRCTAPAILDDLGVEKCLAGTSPEQQARLTEGFPAFVWDLDGLSQ